MFGYVVRWCVPLYFILIIIILHGVADYLYFYFIIHNIIIIHSKITQNYHLYSYFIIVVP